MKKELWKRPIDEKDHADIDIAIAIATDHMTLQATELELGTCWVCHFDPHKASEAPGLPAHIEPVVLLPVGWPAENKMLSKTDSLLRKLFALTNINSYTGSERRIGTEGVISVDCQKSQS